jgi:hypothetical protein
MDYFLKKKEISDLNIASKVKRLTGVVQKTSFSRLSTDLSHQKGKSGSSGDKLHGKLLVIK